MYRKTVQRGIAALALLMTLALLGARPAAAADLGFLDRLSSLWSAVAGEAHVSCWDTIIGWFGAEKTTDSSSVEQDRGMGIDPNGNSLSNEPTDSSVPDGSN